MYLAGSGGESPLLEEVEGLTSSKHCEGWMKLRGSNGGIRRNNCNCEKTEDRRKKRRREGKALPVRASDRNLSLRSGGHEERT